MRKIYYFTDASIYTHDKINIGTSGFVAFNLNLNGNMESGYDEVYNSTSDINYLETLAIYLALSHINNSKNKEDEIIIHTDSNNAYANLKRIIMYYEDEGDAPKFFRFNQFKPIQIQYKNTADLLYSMVYNGFNIGLRCIKSHCDWIEQKSILRQQDINVSDDEAKFICFGNSKADALVHSSSKFYTSKYFKHINEVPFCISV